MEMDYCQVSYNKFIWWLFDIVIFQISLSEGAQRNMDDVKLNESAFYFPNPFVS